jgi:hypothetical protein
MPAVICDGDHGVAIFALQCPGKMDLFFTAEARRRIGIFEFKGAYGLASALSF